MWCEMLRKINIYPFFLVFLLSFSVFSENLNKDFYLKYNDSVFLLYEKIYYGKKVNSDIYSIVESIKKDWGDIYSGEDVLLERRQCAFWIATIFLRGHIEMKYPDYDDVVFREIYRKWKNDSWTNVELSKCRVFSPDSAAVSIVSLLTFPEKFNGKVITVRGVLDSHFEGSYLYLSRDSYNFVDMANSVQISGKGVSEKLNGQGIWITGRFYSENCMKSHVKTGCIKFVNVIGTEMDNYRKTIGVTKQ